MSELKPHILYCHCSYARVVPVEVKQQVLAKLAEEGVAFDAVPDLCEMSARKDPLLLELADGRVGQIIACYPRAVRWLFSAAGSPLPAEGVSILNMREESAEQILHNILGVK